MYRFSLASVLKYREIVEKSRIREMAELETLLAAEERDLAAAVEQLREMADHISRGEKEGIDSREISLYRFSLNGARERIAALEETISGLRDRMEEKRAELVQASVEKKTMERIREKGWKLFLLEQKRKEQKAMDEVASTRYPERG